MATSAKFVADFSDFYQAVDKSTVKLRNWESDIKSVDRSLTKMSSAFMGDKLLRDATLAAKAVDSIGGATKLTAKEQAQLNATLTEALAKYKALGQEAPANMQKLAKETEKQEGLFTKMKNQLGPLGVAMAGAFTVTAITGAISKVLTLSDELTNLSAKTGISTGGLQKLQMAFEQNGVSLDTVTTNVTKLARTIIDGDKSAVAAMNKLGLSVSELKQLAPEQQFIKVADAIGQMQNPTEKAYAAMTIFGKGGAELLQGLDGHLQETTEKFEAMGLVIDEETVAAADKFGDQMGLIGTQLIGVLANAIGPMLPALSALAEAFGFVAKVVGTGLGFVLKGVTIAIVGVWEAIARLLANLGELAQKVPFVGKHLDGLDTSIDWLRGSADKAHKMVVDLALSTEQTGEVARAVTPAMLGLGEATEKTGKKFEWTAAQIKYITAQMALFEKAADSVQLFYATVAQDMDLQNVSKRVAVLFSDIENGLGKVQTIDLKAWAGADFGLGAPAQAATMELAMLRAELGKLGVAFDKVAKDSTSAIGALTDGFKTGLQSLWEGMSGGKGFAGLMNNLGAGIVEGFGNIISGGLTSVINMGVSMAVEGVKKIAGLIGDMFQSEESKHVNRPRDQFFGQFGGYEGLANQLTGTLIDQGNGDAGNVAHGLINALNDSRTEAQFKSAQRSIGDVFAQSGRRIEFFNQGTQGRFLDFGSGTPAMLHGKERVMTEAEGQAESATVVEIRLMREAMERQQRDMTRSLTVAFKNAITLAS